MIAARVMLAGTVAVAAPQSVPSDDGGDESAPTVLCASPDAEVEPTVITDALSGSEDLAFDGTGGLVAKRDDDLVRVTASGEIEVIGSLPGQTFGLRFDAAGALVAAQVDDGQVVVIDDEATSTLASDLGRPNGVFGDLDGNIWVTAFDGNQVIRIDGDGEATVVVDGDPASAPNGIVVDADRGHTYFTNYYDGTILRTDATGADPTAVTTIDGQLDGLVLDRCGSVYVVDNANNRLYFVPLDDDGATAEPRLVAQFATSVANAQFGAGDGWNPDSLYVVGVDGVVYEVPVGGPGALVPTATGSLD